MSNWITALKKWNEGKSSWCVPRKGTQGYKEIIAIMETLPKKKSKMSKYEQKIKTLIPGINVNADRNLKPLPKEFIPDENNLKDMKKYAKILKDKVKNKKLTEREYNRYILEVNEQIKKLKAKV